MKEAHLNERILISLSLNVLRVSACTQIHIRPLLKLILFPRSHRNNPLIFVYLVFSNYLIFQLVLIICIHRYKHIKVLVQPTGLHFGHPLDRKQTYGFLMVHGLDYTCTMVYTSSSLLRK